MNAEDASRIRRLWPVALLIGAVVAVCWIRSGPNERPPTPRADARSASGTTDPETRATGVDDQPATAAPAQREPVDIAPPPDDGLQVTLLTIDDVPVPDVTVELEARIAGSGSSGSRFARDETDARGAAVLVVEPERLRALEAIGSTLEFEVVARVALPDAPRARIDGDPRAAEPVVLRVAGFGSAEVRVTDPAGDPVDDGGRVYLFWRTPGSDGRWERVGIPSAASTGGVARFDIVPLERELLFRATGGGAFVPGETTVLGPTRAGQSIASTIRLGPALPFVTGRLVDETGSPIANLPVSTNIGSVPRDAPPDTVPDRRQVTFHGSTTDADGRFRTVVDRGAEPTRRRVLVLEQDDRRGPGGGEVIRRALVSLDFDLRGGADHDLGTITLVPNAEERVLVAGIVVDENGQPFGSASVSAGFWDRDAGRFVALHRTRIRSGADGRFEIRSTADAPTTFTISAGADKRVPASIEATPGARDIELALRRGGALHAWVRVPEGVPAYQLVGRIGDGEPNQFGGRFGYDNLAPGRHDVAVRIRGTSWEVARVPGVVVTAGEVADDPRLDGIEVRVRVLRLCVLDSGGAPLADTLVRLEDRDGRGGSRKTDADGRLLAVVPSAVEVFVVGVDAGTRAEVSWRPEEQRIRLGSR